MLGCGRCDLNTGIAEQLGAWGDLLGLAAFAGLALLLWNFARQKEA